MKKRLISALLVLCMLVTMVPAIALAGSAADEPAEEFDYNSLYVSDGLTILLTAWDASEKNTSLDVAGGTWASVAGSNTGFTAILHGTAGKATWRTATIGDGIQAGIGYDMTVGNCATHNAYIEMGIENLPEKDYTVEYVANILGVTQNGDTTKRYVDNATYGYGNPGGFIYGPMKTGRISPALREAKGGTTGIPDVSLDSQFEFRWVYKKADTGLWYGEEAQLIFDNSMKTVYQDQIYGVEKFYGIAASTMTCKINKPNADYTGATATYSVYSGLKSTPETSVSFSSKQGSGGTAPMVYVMDKAECAKFEMFDMFPANIYAIRVYDRALTGSEVLTNHFADIASYYRLDMTSFEAAGLTSAQIGARFANVKLADTNKEAYEAGKVAAQELLEGAVIAASYEYASLYVQDGLTSLFLAYTDSGVELENNTWVDAATGKAASVQNPNYSAYGDGAKWTYGTHGGLTLKLTVAEATGYDGSKNIDKVPAIRLPIEVLGYDKYTVEVIANVVGVYNDDRTTPAAANGLHAPYVYSMAFGPFTGMMWDCGFRWNYTASSGWNGQPGGGGKNWLPGGLTAMRQESWYNSHRTEVSTMTVEFEKVSAQGKYTLYYNQTVAGGFSTETFGPGKTNSTMPAYMAPDTGYFAVLANMSGTVYSVRTYNRKLTALEVQQNHFADLAAFYQLDVSVFKELDASSRTGAYSAASSVKISETNYEATKASLQAIVDTSTRQGEKTTYDELYISDGLLGLYTAFGNDASVDVAKGTWLNKAAPGSTASLTGGAYNAESNKTGWFVGEHGGVSYEDTGFSADANKLVLNGGMLAGSNYTVDTMTVIGVRNIEPPRKVISGTGLTVVDSGDTRTVKCDTGSVLFNGGASSMKITVTGPANTTRSLTAVTDQSGYGNAGTYHSTRDITVRFDASGSAVASNAYAGRYLTITTTTDVTVVSVDVKVNSSDYGVVDAFQFGPAYTYFWTNKLGSNNWSNGFGLSRFYYSLDNWNVHAGVAANGCIKNAGDSYCIEEQFNGKGINGFEVVKSTAQDGTVTYKYEKNGTAFFTYSVTKAQAIAGNGNFVMFHNLPCSVYAVRVYDRVLSDAEIKYNHFVDMAAFYQLDLSAFVAMTPDDRLAFASGYANMQCTAENYNSQKVALQATMNAKEQTAADEVYVRDGLIGLYTAYNVDGQLDPTVDLANGIWYNKAGISNNATIYGGVYDSANRAYGWRVGEKGGIYTIKTLNNYNTKTAHGQTTGVELPLSMLAGDFTVETVMLFRGVTNADGSTVTVTDATRFPYGVYNASTYSFRFGMLGTVNWIGNGPGGNAIHARWCYADTYWGGGHNGGAWLQAAQGYRQVLSSSIANKVLTMRVTYEDNYGDNANCGHFVVRYNGSYELNYTTGALGYKKNNENGGFYIMDSDPGDLYAIRVYNRVLTEQEYVQNHFADLAGYAEGDLSSYGGLSADQKAALANFFAATDFSDVDKASFSRTLDAFNKVALDNTLYVKEGLVSLFQAYNDDDLDLANGKWFDLLNPTTAKLVQASGAAANGSAWTFGPNGGVGYADATDKMIDNYIQLSPALVDRDNYTVEVVKQLDLRDLGQKFNAVTATETAISGGKNFALKAYEWQTALGTIRIDVVGAPDAKVTLKIRKGSTAAEAKAAEVTETVELTLDAAGKRSYTTTKGVKTAYYDVDVLGTFTSATFYGGTTNELSSPEAFVIGNLYALCWTNKSGSNSWGNGFGDTRWYYAKANWSNHNGNAQNPNFVATLSTNRYLTVYSGEVTTMYLQKQTGDGSVTYQGYDKSQIIYNGTLTAAQADAVIDPNSGAAVGAAFNLFRKVPGTVYAIRVYDHVLSAEEKAQNHLADIIAFFGLDKEVYNGFTKEQKQTATDVLAGFDFDADPAVVESAFEVVAKNEGDKTAYDEAYVQSGLVALFTAYGTDLSVNLAKGTWYNKLNKSEVATIEGARWTYQNNGLGYSMTKEQWDSGKNNTGIKLPEKYMDLANYTVDIVAKFEAITNADGTQYQGGNGCYSKAPSGFRFGLLGANDFASIDPENSMQSLTIRWYFDRQSYAVRGWKSSMPTVVSGGPYLNDNFRNASATLDSVNLMQVVFTTAGNGDVTFKVNHDYSNWVTNTIASGIYNTAMTSANPEEGTFKIFYGYPATVYAVRVYNRTLTEAENLHNHFVDIAAYYKLDLSQYNNMSGADKTALENVFKDVTIGKTHGETLIRALYGFYTGDVVTMGQAAVTFEGFEPIVGEKLGYRTVFKLASDAEAIFAAGGYRLIYGVVSGVGDFGTTHKNSLSDLTVSYNGSTVTTSAQNAKVNVISQNMTMNQPGGRLFSSAVIYDNASLYGAGVVSRAFLVVVNPKGVASIYYDDAVETKDGKVFNGSVSMVDMADYCINYYNGDVLNTVSYLQNATLRKIVTDAGLEARTSIGDEFTVYVRTSGNDANQGLAAGSAVATVGRAFAIAKALFTEPSTKGVTIDIGAGTFYVPSTLSLTGDEIASDTYYFYIKGAGESTVLTGAKTLNAGSFRNDPDSGYDYYQFAKNGNTYPLYRYVYQNGNIVKTIHTGSAEDYRVFTEVETIDDQRQTVKVYMDADLFDESYGNYAMTEVHITYEWNFNIVHIDHVDYNDTKRSKSYGSYSAHDLVAVYVSYNEWIGMATYQTLKGRAYWLENNIGLIASSTEYNPMSYYDEATGKLWLFNNDNCNNVQVSDIETLLSFKDLSNVVVSNMKLTGVDNKFVSLKNGLGGGQAGVNGKTWFNDTGKEGGSFLTIAALAAKNMKNFTVSGLTIEKVGGDGINLSGYNENITISSNKVSNVGETAIRMGTNNAGWNNSNKNLNVLIDNNYVNGTGEYFKQCPAVLLSVGANVQIVRNTVMNASYSAFSLGWSWGSTTRSLAEIGLDAWVHLFNVEVAYNYLSDFMTCMRDGGAIYILGGNANIDTHDYLNFMHDNYINITEATGLHTSGGNAGRWFMGYYHDGSSSNWYDYHNAIINTTTTGIGSLVPYYIQGIDGQLSLNIKMDDNYAIGFQNEDWLYGGGKSTSTNQRLNLGSDKTSRGERYISVTNMHLYTSAANVLSNKLFTTNTYGTLTTAAPAGGSDATISQIYGNSGSTLGKGAVGYSATYKARQPEMNLVTALNDGEMKISTVADISMAKFSVKFIDQGNIVYETTVNGGSTFTLGQTLPTPTKAETESSTFRFTGWTGYTPGMTITTNVEFVANFVEEVKTFTITFYDAIGEVYAVKDNVPYGAVAQNYVPEEVPEKAEEAIKTFKFKNWYSADNEVDGLPIDNSLYLSVKSDLEFYPVYTEVMKTFTYKFVLGDVDGNPIMDGDEFKVVFGQGTTTANNNIQYHNAKLFDTANDTAGKIFPDNRMQAIEDLKVEGVFPFDGPDGLGQYIPEATAEVTYVWNGKYQALNPETFEPITTCRASNTYLYNTDPSAEFALDRITVAVNEDVIFVPVFDQVPTKHEITFVNNDGIELGTVTVAYGAKLTALPTYLQPANELQTVTVYDGEENVVDFAEFVMPAADVRMKVVKVQSYTITFKNFDGTELSKTVLVEGAVITAPAEEPVKDTGDGKTWNFVGYEGFTEGMEVTGDATFVAQFEEASAVLYGDVNGDNEITIADVSALVGYLKDSSKEIILANADVNGDSEIGISDVSRLVAYLKDSSIVLGE